MENKIRQPIVTVAGHVDHGKTTLLDMIRKTAVAGEEVGGITQKISFTKIPINKIKDSCPLIEKKGIELEIPGFLFIDTPGHAAFSHLRKRGGSLADLAILIMDITEGIKPQTAEVIEILKMNKTPFIVALNKVDKISGWRKQSDDLKENIEKQAVNTQQIFQEKMLTIVGSLYSHGFNAKPYYEVSDFTSQLALVPCSAKNSEGIWELIMMLCGISQKFLKNNLTLNELGKGVVLEIKKEKTIQYAEAILYDGHLSQKDELLIASFGAPIQTKIRILEEILPVSNKFHPILKTSAATGIRMQLITGEEILPGMPFSVLSGNVEEIKKEFKKEVEDEVITDEKGIIVKADSLGSLEALAGLLKQERIKIIKAGIGRINKKDIISAQTNVEKDPVNAVVVGFNVEEDEDILEMDLKNIRIIKEEVIYQLIDNLLEFQKEKRQEIEKEKLMRLAKIGQVKILPQYIFRNSNPAVFGVEVDIGKIITGMPLIDADGNSIAKIKDIQEDKTKLKEAVQGKQVAISLPGVTFDKQLQDKVYLYSDLSEGQFREFKKNKELLSSDEVRVIQKIAQIKRKFKSTWGV